MSVRERMNQKVREILNQSDERKSESEFEFERVNHTVKDKKDQ